MLRTVTVAAALATGVVALAVARGWSDRVDARLLAAMRWRPTDRADGKPAKLAAAARDLTALGGDALRLLFVVGCAAALIADARASVAAVLVGIVAVARIALAGLKAVVRRPRPPTESAIVVTYTASFPSGHSFMAVVVYLSAALLIPVGAAPALVATLAGLALLIPLAIGATRVAFGIHWPTDVIAGWLAGIAWTGASLIVVAAAGWVPA